MWDLIDHGSVWNKGVMWGVSSLEVCGVWGCISSLGMYVSSLEVCILLWCVGV